MKPCTLAVHKSFPADSVGDRDVTLYVSNGKSLKSVEKIIGPEKINKFITGLAEGTIIRATSVNASDVILLGMKEAGAVVMYAHWHNLGLAKSLSPEEIAFRVAQEDPSLFQEFNPDQRIAELKQALSIRNAMVGFYNDAKRRVLQSGRNMGVTDPSTSDEITSSLEALKVISKLFAAKTGKTKTGLDGEQIERTISWDTQVEKLALQIPHCVLFAQIAGFDSMGTAAAVVACTNGIERFPDVAAYWHYFGQHVVNGGAPKRKKGAAFTWNPTGRCALYLMGQSIMKNKNNPWNAVYKACKEQELKVHAVKHPNCPSPAGHCDARARRRVVKEILKCFYLAATDQEYVSGHKGGLSAPEVIGEVA